MATPHRGQILLSPFRSGDLEPIVALWNACLPKDAITVERFWRLFLLDPNFRSESAFVASIHGIPVGFVQAMMLRTPIGVFPRDPLEGWITVFFVAPEYRRQGIGRILIQAGLQFLKEHGCRYAKCNGYAPYYAFPGVDIDSTEALGFMLSMGFRPLAEAVAMDLTLNGLQTPNNVVKNRESLSAEGVFVSQFEMADTLPLLKLAELHFPLWRQSLIAGLQKNHADMFVAIKGGDVLGFAQWQNPQTDPPTGAPGRFGPFGIHPELRGKGLGAVLFYTLIEEVIARGAEKLWFGWAGGRNLSFYERAGCQITRRYQTFQYEFR